MKKDSLRIPARKSHACALSLALALSLAAAVPMAGCSQQQEGGQPAQEQQEQRGLDLEISAEGWTDDSSAMVAHLAGTASDGTAVDTYHAFTASGDRTLDIADGDYELTWIPAINADGSIFRAPDAQQVKVEGGRAEASSSFEQVPADQVAADDIDAILDGLTDAVAKGDSTLQGDAAKDVVGKAAANAANCPNADKEAVEAKKDVAGAVTDAKSEGKDASQAKSDAVAKHPAASAPSSSASGSSSSSASAPASGGSSASASAPSQPSQPAHTHSWVPVQKTVHHEAEYSSVMVCKACGVQSPSAAHMEQHALAGESTQTVSKRVKVKDAWSEIVTTGYKCSGCGATK